MKKLRTLNSRDHVTIVFGEWFHKSAGNTYYDAKVRINGEIFEVPHQYGYNAGDKQSIDEALSHCGYKVRHHPKDRFKPYHAIHIERVKKLQRELYK